MNDEDIKLLAVIVKYVLVPAIGFAAGFFAKWFLQSRKSRDELLRELAPQRAEALRSLWVTTTLPADIESLDNDTILPSDFRQNADLAIGEWYTKEAGALFLSWHATQQLFRLIDVLRNSESNKKALREAVSSLRTQLKRDCGLYSAWESTQKLARPRSSSWSNNSAVERESSNGERHLSP